MIDIKLQGFEELTRQLKEIPVNLAKNDLRSAVGAAAKVVRDEARVLAPFRTGTLRRAIYMKQIREESGPTRQTYYVGARGGKQYRSVGKKGANQDAFYARFVELGHFTRRAGGRLRDTDRGGRNNGRLASEVQSGAVKWVAPQPFLRPALFNKREAAIEAMKNRLRDRLAKYAR